MGTLEAANLLGFLVEPSVDRRLLRTGYLVPLQLSRMTRGDVKLAPRDQKPALGGSLESIVPP